jgi:hypothetical protein
MLLIPYVILGFVLYVVSFLILDAYFNFNELKLILLAFFISMIAGLLAVALINLFQMIK